MEIFNLFAGKNFDDFNLLARHALSGGGEFKATSCHLSAPNANTRF
jgi:hypothetical protein